MMTAYGHQIESDDDVFTKLAREAAGNLVGPGSAGAAIVDAIPLRESKVLHSKLKLMAFSALHPKLGSGRWF